MFAKGLIIHARGLSGSSIQLGFPARGMRDSGRRDLRSYLPGLV